MPPVVKLPGLRHQRELAALTQQQLAKRAGLYDYSHVSKLERGSNARPTTVRKLADALGCTPSDLILGNTKNTPAG
jgi:transcriptional regulator with XRE-family HTH domain